VRVSFVAFFLGKLKAKLLLSPIGDIGDIGDVGVFG
jgi:hypothetical protein